MRGSRLLVLFLGTLPFFLHGASGVRRRPDTGKCTSPFFLHTLISIRFAHFPGSGFLVAYRRRDVSRAQQRVCDGQHLLTDSSSCVIALFEYPTAVEIVSTDIDTSSTWKHTPLATNSDENPMWVRLTRPRGCATLFHGSSSAFAVDTEVVSPTRCLDQQCLYGVCPVSQEFRTSGRWPGHVARPGKRGKSEG